MAVFSDNVSLGMIESLWGSGTYPVESGDFVDSP